MEPLFSEFLPLTATAWKEKLQKDLKGLTFEELIGLDASGLNIDPFYNTLPENASNEPVFYNNEWIIISKIVVEHAKEDNLLALSALQSGAEGLMFEIENLQDWEVLFKDIQFEYIKTILIIKGNSEVMQSLIDFCKKEKITLGDNFVIECDPIQQIMCGTLPVTAFSEYLDQLQAFLNPVICINPTIYEDAGANTITALSCIAGHLNEYLHQYQLRNLLLQLKSVHITLTVNTQFFEQIAKLRSLRLICATLFDAYNIQPELNIHINTTSVNKAGADVYNNLLRDTIAAMSGVIGGTDSILVTDYDDKQSPFSRRMSKNQLLILKEESYLSKVADISAGSYLIEQRTQAINQAAWKQFQTLESNGGLLDIVANGTLWMLIAEQANQLIEAYRSGKRVLIGVNKYPNPIDMPAVHDQQQTINYEHGLQSLKLAQIIL